MPPGQYRRAFGFAPDLPSVTRAATAIKDASRRLRGGRRPSLTAATARVFARSGRDGETALNRTKKLPKGVCVAETTFLPAGK